MNKEIAKQKYQNGEIQIFYDNENLDLIREIIGEKIDGNFRYYRYSINNFGCYDCEHNPYSSLPIVCISEITESEEGIKESDNKLFYELDFGFITQMAERMESSDKYPVFNWKKSMDTEPLKQALFRHVIALMNGELEDDGREFGHLEAIATNAMLINYQLKNK